jgi:hypothetical protein
MSGWLLTTGDGRQIAIHGGYWEIDDEPFGWEALPFVGEVISAQAGNDLLVLHDGSMLTTDDVRFVGLITDYLGVTWDPPMQAALT